MNELFPSNRDFWDMGKRFFDSSFDDMFSRSNAFKADIRETENSYLLEADLPGMEKEDIEVDYHDNVLSISASHESGKDETDEKGNYIRRERQSSHYSRQFLLKDVKAEDISASFNNGVLTVQLPKHDSETKPSTKIDIK
ncbi:Hsp20/alpha crystallin family protein [Lacticigenium naphthae]|uniref:Hsp20/alpha crystallin family protein n=1 Tax=Lacticigenium naphthae TaxID=515351 RepID=UPI0003F9E521|nr:Hsp20/alpha crystallin family protein [Lacticigenium naphthae]